MPFSDRTFTIKDGDETTFDIAIAAPPLVAQGLRFDTWGGAFILSNLLYKISLPDGALRSNEADFQVLELGSGTGLTGLSAALIWQCSVVLTDLEEVLSGIRDNIVLNAARLKLRRAKASCGLLDWRIPSHISLYDSGMSGSIPCEGLNKPGVILAADTMYSEEQPEILTNAIVAWLRREDSSRALICYPMRVAYIDYIRDFWNRMTESGLEPAQEGREMLSEEDGFDDERLCEWSVWKWSAKALNSSI